MRQHSRDQIIRFLQEVDRHLSEDVAVVVIGGAAAILAGAERPTSDIDTASKVTSGVQDAVTKANARMGLNLAVSFAAVADYPYNYEDRLIQVTDPPMARLSLSIPEQHDLALIKVIRGVAKDFEALEEIHRLNPFDFDVLVGRFLNEMSHVVKDSKILVIQFLALLAQLFGHEKARTVETQLYEWADRVADPLGTRRRR